MKRNYQIALLAVIVSGAIAPNYESFVHGKHANKSESWNITQINDAKLNSLVDEMSRSFDFAQSAKLSQEIQERIESLHFYIPSIDDISSYYLARNRVKFPSGIDADIASGIFDYNLFWVDDSGSAIDQEKSKSSFDWLSPTTWFKN